MKKSLIFLSAVILSFSISAILSQAEKTELSASQAKEADQFYTALPNNEYKEYSNASIKIREKVSYKDVNKLACKLGEAYVTKKKIGSDLSIDRNQQVYFYASVVDNNKMILRKYAIYDAETKERISAQFNIQAKREAVDKGKFA